MKEHCIDGSCVTCGHGLNNYARASVESRAGLQREPRPVCRSKVGEGGMGKHRGDSAEPSGTRNHKASEVLGITGDLDSCQEPLDLMLREGANGYVIFTALRPQFS